MKKQFKNVKINENQLINFKEKRDMLYTCFLVYIIFVNIMSAIVCIIDKLSAIYGNRRISEKTLMLLSILGGGVLMYITMQIIRHKTKHNKFMIGLPIVIMLQVTVILLFLKIFS